MFQPVDLLMSAFPLLMTLSSCFREAMVPCALKSKIYYLPWHTIALKPQMPFHFLSVVWFSLFFIFVQTVMWTLLTSQDKWLALGPATLLTFTCPVTNCFSKSEVGMQVVVHGFKSRPQFITGSSVSLHLQENASSSFLITWSSSSLIWHRPIISRHLHHSPSYLFPYHLTWSSFLLCRHRELPILQLLLYS